MRKILNMSNTGQQLIVTSSEDDSILEQGSEKFVQNLKALYDRRIQSSFHILDSLKEQHSNMGSFTLYLDDLEGQLRQNQVTAENEIRLKKQQLIMEIERLYEIAIKDIGFQVKLREDQIEERRQEIEERQGEIDRCCEMVKMRIRGETQ